MVDSGADERAFKFRRLSSEGFQNMIPDSKPMHQALCDWPSLCPTIESVLAGGPGIESQLSRRLSSRSGRMWLSSSYSGLCTFDFCYIRLREACQGIVPDGALISSYIWSAHEVDDKARYVLLKSGHCPQHVFGDLRHQVEEEVLHKMDFVVKTLKTRASEIPDTLTQKEKKKKLDDLNDKCMRKLFALVRAAWDNGKVKEEGYCFNHKQNCPYKPPLIQGDVWLETGGNTCISFSPQGSRGRWLHESAIPCAIWLVLFGCRKGDWLLQECSHLFNTEEALSAAFAAAGVDYTISALKISPTDVGVPMRRPRRFSWSVRSDKFEILWPITFENFHQICGAEPLGSGHDFFCADSDMVKDQFEQLAQKRWGGHVPDGPWIEFLPAGYKTRLLGYRDYEKEGGNPEGVVPIFDLSQSVTVRKKFSSMLPSPLCKSMFWSEKARREMLSQELMCAMGWPIPGLVPDANGKTRRCPLPDNFFQALNDAAVFKLLGNSVHCRVAGLLLVFSMAVTKQK